MEEGSHVWLRSPKSEWGWLPAKIIRKEVVTIPSSSVSKPGSTKFIAENNDTGCKDAYGRYRTSAAVKSLSSSVGGGGDFSKPPCDNNDNNVSDDINISDAIQIEGEVVQPVVDEKISTVGEDRDRQPSDEQLEQSLDRQQEQIIQVEVEDATKDQLEVTSPENTMIELTLVDDFDGLRLEGNNTVIAITGNTTIDTCSGKTSRRKKGKSNTSTGDYYANAQPFTEIIRIANNAFVSARGEEHPDIKLRNVPMTQYGSSSSSSASILQLNNNNNKSRASHDGGVDNVDGSSNKTTAALTMMIQDTVTGGVDDLIGLTHLHEPAILHAIRLRYDADIIYTSTGPILLAINPFKRMEGVYGRELMDLYRQQGEDRMYGVGGVASSGYISPSPSPKERSTSSCSSDVVSSSLGAQPFHPSNHIPLTDDGTPIPRIYLHRPNGKLPPHVYQAADDAYRAMMRGIEIAAMMKGGGRGLGRGIGGGGSVKDKKRTDEFDVPANQSILVSGESGAGKTVTTKIVLNYFAMLSQKSQEDSANSTAMAKSGGVISPRQLTGVAVTESISTRKTTPERDYITTGKEADESVEHQVLLSNPVLEAFGNARTIRNDNSSRFGKYVNIAFTNTGQLVRASIDTYLLEKVRLLHQAPGERNFHIFYQFLEAASDEERKELLLNDFSTQDFYLTNQSDTYERRDHVNDADMHKEMVDAMEIMHFGSDTVNQLMRLIAAVLFAGNMTFSTRKTATYGDSAMLEDTEASQAVAQLLGVSFDNLAASLTSKVIFARGDVIHKGLDQSQAEKSSEALIKSIYGAAFDYIAEKINASINSGSGVPQVNGSVGRSRQTSLRRGQSSAGDEPINIIPPGGASIGVLDIFGFETFDVNGFEQLCINYTNETLQQQFNKFVFKLEQQVYEREGILWKFIPFPDNQDVLNLIDKPRTGILQILDEQCMVDWGTEQKFSLSLYSTCDSMSQRFHVSPPQRVRNKFSVEHYAGLVEYSTENWLEKNKDQLPAASAELLESSSFELIKHIKKYVRSEGAKIAMKSLGKQFSDSLKVLRTRIDATMPHYVRCLKPNDGLEPDHFDPKNIVEQLRYCGVLEAVRVSRAGYPTRYPHEVFVTRYYMLCPNRGSDVDNLSPYHNEIPTTLTEEQKQLKRLVSRMATEIWTTEQVMFKRIAVDPERQDTPHALAQPKDLTEFLQLDFSSRCAVAGLQLGKSKVFLRREAFECIESIRNQKFGKNSTIISKSWRRFSAILYRKRAGQTVILIQSLVRRWLAAAKTNKLMSEFRAIMRMKAAAAKVQRCYRSYYIVAYKEGAELRKAKHSVLIIQACIRGHLARKNIATLLYKYTKLQSHVRRIQVRKEYLKKRHAIIIIQSIARILRALRDVEEAKKQRAALKIQSIARMKIAFVNFRRKVCAASIIKRRYREHLYPEQTFFGTFLKRYYMLGDPKDVKTAGVAQLKKKKILLARHRNAIISSKRHELSKLVHKLALEMWEPGLFESFLRPGDRKKSAHIDFYLPAQHTAGNVDSSLFHVSHPSLQLLQMTPIPLSQEEYMNRSAPSRLALVGMQMCHGTVFLRPETHVCLETRRNELVSGSSAKIQAIARRKLAVNNLALKRTAAIKLQSFFRMHKEKKKLDPMRHDFAATKIQSAVRMSSTRKRVWRTYWSTQSSDLFAFIEHENWYMVERMLHKNPLLVEEADLTTGELPLHKIAERASAWTLLIEMILTLYPKAVGHKDFAGQLPIHHAAYAGNLTALEIIFESYKNGARDADDSGRCPIHVAAEHGSIEAIKFLTMKLPECTHAATSGGSSLPLHLACKNYCSVGVVTSLLRSPLNFSLASRTDDNGELPLHLLLRCGADVDVVAVKSLLTCYLNAVETRDQGGDVPLHIALKHHCKPAVIQSLLMHFPGASVAADGQGHSPLFLALTHSAADETTVLLINYAPQIVTMRDNVTGKLPIETATENEQSLFIIYRLLKLDMPIDLKERIQVRLIPHFYSWNHILLNVGDKYYQVVSKILQQCTQPQVLALAHVEDSKGKIALASATPICRHEIRVMLRLFNTLELVKQRPAFTNGASDTEIFYALRYEPPPEQSNLFSIDFSAKKVDDDYTEDWDDDLSHTSNSSMRIKYDEEANLSVAEKLKLIRNEKGQHVIAKITPRSDIVERELKIRKDFNLSRHYVPSVISVHHTIHHGAYQNAQAEPAYCITIEGADATVEHQMLDYRRVGKAFPSSELRRIGISLLHLHENGLVHTDFGPHNVGKFGPLFKMLGVGGCVRIGDQTNPKHGIYHSPEAIVVENIIVDGKERKTARVIPVKASPAIDLWSFGHMVYESVVGAPLSAYSHRGQRVKSSNLAKIARWDDPSLQRELMNVDAADTLARNVISKLLHPDPNKRFKSIREAISDPFFTTDSGDRKIKRERPH